MKNAHSKLILSGFLTFAVLSFTHGQKRAIEERADRLIETSDLLTVKGTVTAFDHYYVRNAEVTSRKTRSRAITDSLGMFGIMATRGDVLLFRANGFEKHRRKLSADENDITVNMILVPGEKNVKSAVDHGHMYENDIRYALEHFNIINHDYRVYHDMRDLLQASLPGTRVTDHGGIQVYINGRNSGSSGLEHNGADHHQVMDRY